MSLEIDTAGNVEGLSTSQFKLKIRAVESGDKPSVEFDLVGPCSIIARECEIVGEKYFEQGSPRRIINLTHVKGGFIDTTRVHATQTLAIDFDFPNSEKRVQIFAIGK